MILLFTLLWVLSYLIMAEGKINKTLLIIIIILLDCPENYQYERQPPTNFTDCNPVKTILQLTCSVLVPHDSTTVTVDWYWSKNINECGRNITEEQGRVDIYIGRIYAQFNTDRIITDLTIDYPHTDTGYYWCQVNDTSYNGVFISSDKAPVFDTGTMSICSATQFVNYATCASTSNISTLSSFMCFISTQTVSLTIYNSILTSGYNETVMSISDIKNISSTVTITVTTVSGNTFKKSLVIATDLSSTQTDDLFYSTSIELYTTTSLVISSNSVNHTSDIFTSHESNTTTEHLSQLTVYQSSSCVAYTNYSKNNDNDTIELISGLFVLSIIMFGLGGILGGLLTVLWNKKRERKGRAVIIIILLFNL